LIKDRSKLILEKIADKKLQQEEYTIDKVSQEITDPIRLKISFLSGYTTINKDPRFLYADADKLSFPLTLRKWQSGDWFVPFGMRGRKKLSDFFTDRKFSLADKENAWVLSSGENIVWIVGERPDERFKVTESTENVMVVEFIKN